MGFFHVCLQLLQNTTNSFQVILGAKFLKITSEEFLSPRDDISYTRMSELRSFLQARVVPDIFTLLLSKCN